MRQRLAVTLLALGLTGCWYWPAGTRRPYGHERLPQQDAPLERGRHELPTSRSAESLVLHRPESSVLQPIGGVYAPDLVATIEAPDAPLDVFECLGDAMAATGLGIRKDYATSSGHAAFDPSLVPGEPIHVRLHVTELRLDSVWARNEQVDRSRMAASVSVTGPRGEVRYSRAHAIAGAGVHRSDAPLMCILGETLARELVSDPAFRDAVRVVR